MSFTYAGMSIYDLITYRSLSVKQFILFNSQGKVACVDNSFFAHIIFSYWTEGGRINRKYYIIWAIFFIEFLKYYSKKQQMCD